MSAQDKSRRNLLTPALVVLALLTVAVAAFTWFFGKERTAWQDQNRNSQASGSTTASKAPYTGIVGLNGTLKYGDDLVITLTEIELPKGTSQYQVKAKVWVRGQAEITISKAVEGYGVEYPPEHGYRIDLVEAKADRAKFTITKNP